jgi:P27 family predicted phage terminase small subunit
MTGRKPKKPTRIATPESDELPATLEPYDPPDWLSIAAKNIWMYCLLEVEKSGHRIPRQNLEVFTGYVQAAATAKEADIILQKEGLTVSDGRAGTRRHPLVSVRSQALLQLRAYAESLGLTPASSSRLPLPPIPEQPNPFADL